MVGEVSDFQCLVKLSLEAKRTWVVVYLRGPGMFSMFRFRSASAGVGGIGIFVMLVRRLNVSIQYFWKAEHDQKIWKMSPLWDLNLKHVLGVWGLKEAILAGVKYHRSEIFWVSSHNVKHWVTLYTDLRASCHCASEKVVERSASHWWCGDILVKDLFPCRRV